MKKIIQCVFFLTICVLLSSCSAQKNIDTYEFCDRLNNSLNKVLISPNDFYKTQGTNDFSYFTSTCDGRTIQITLTQSDAGTVCDIQLTAVCENVGLSDSERQEMFEIYNELCSTLLNEKRENISTTVNNNSLTESLVAFENKNLQFTTDEAVFSYFSNEEIITMCCERK